MGITAILVLFFGLAAGTSATSCDICRSAYEQTASSSIATDEQKCIAAKEYIRCLVGTSGSGCDQRPSRLATAVAEVQRVNGISGKTCQLTDSCLCETNFYRSDLSTRLKRCYASVVQNQCAIAASSTACDDTTTNTVYRVSTSVTWVNTCKNTGSVTVQSTMTVAMATILAALLRLV
ncbi:uncharacterized protein [Haliotis asinina]|uniref:uncharacterized protein n=1 Tax=Haliotis asinina TaxID=109174 RepID=UPI00353272F1